MASLELNGQKIHYEVMGESGKTLVVLNGIFMSITSWAPFYNAFQDCARVVYIDFLDQGTSNRMEEQYTQVDQVEVVEKVLSTLNVEQCCLMGISYGGEVALQYVLTYPNRIESLVLANTAARTSPWLKSIGDGWNQVGMKADGKAYYHVAIPIVYSTQFYQKRLEWMKKREQLLIPIFEDKTVMRTFERLVKSAENYNVIERLGEIKCPTLIISASDDALTPLNEQRILSQGIVESDWVVIQDCGHASMYERPQTYAALVTGFLNHANRKMEI